jgi:glycine cleavage system aminomethyltransferase T
VTTPDTPVQHRAPRASPVDDLAVLQFEGPDAATFLQGQLSSDVAALAPGALQRSSYNSPKGRMLASLVLARADGGGFRAVVAADLADKVLSTMSEDDRVVLMLMDGEEASVKEVAEATGWSESNVKVKAMRARRRMREAVEKLLGI